MKLTVERKGEKLSFEIRGASVADRVTARVIDSGVLYIRISTFEGAGIAKRVDKLIHQNLTAATSGIILDVRNNPGGRAEEANGVADIFLDGKNLEIFQFSDGKRITLKSKPDALVNPVVVLTDRNTASSAEMLAMALRDNHRAVIVGQPTAGLLYGKSFEKLDGGGLAVFRSGVTILSPNGNDYAEVGLSPDISVEDGKDFKDDAILVRAVKALHDPPRPDSVK